MKVRHGFVSNSSSSSFTMILSVEDHNKILEQMDSKLHPYLDYVIGKIKIGSQDLVVFDLHGGEAFEYIPPCGEFKGLDKQPKAAKQFPDTEEGEEDSMCFEDYSRTAEEEYRKIAKTIKCKAIIIATDR